MNECDFKTEFHVGKGYSNYEEPNVVHNTCTYYVRIFFTLVRFRFIRSYFVKHFNDESLIKLNLKLKEITRIFSNL